MALYDLASTSISSLTLPFIFSWSLNSIHNDCPSESHICWSVFCVMLFPVPGAFVLCFRLANDQLSSHLSPVLGSFPDLHYAITRYRRLGGLNNRNALSHCSGGWKSKIKVLAGLIPSKGCEGRICSRPLFLAQRWLSSSCISSHGLSSMCVFVSVSQFLFFIRTPVILD